MFFSFVHLVRPPFGSHMVCSARANQIFAVLLHGSLALTECKIETRILLLPPFGTGHYHLIIRVANDTVIWLQSLVR